MDEIARLLPVYPPKARPEAHQGFMDHEGHDRGREEVQSDGRIRRWTWIEDQSKFLRVILLEDGETIHNAFFDRGFKK